MTNTHGIESRRILGTVWLEIQGQEVPITFQPIFLLFLLPTSNPFQSAGQVRGLNGSTHLSSTRLEFWSRSLGQHSRSSSAFVKQT